MYYDFWPEIKIIQDFPDEIEEDSDIEVNPKIKVLNGVNPVQGVGCFV